MKGAISVVGVSSRLSEEKLQLAVECLAKLTGRKIKTQLSAAQWVNPQQRTSLFLEAIQDPDVDFLLAARGGEGGADMIPFLMPHQDYLRKNPKTFCGMSDNTPILLFLRECGWRTIYGPVASHFAGEVSESLRSDFQAVLSEKSWSMPLLPLNQKARESNLIEAETTGGNLTLLQLSLKDSFEFSGEGKILFFEEWNEQGFQIDRVLKSFARIGKFKGIKALVIGNLLGDLPSSFTPLNPTQQEALNEVISRHAAGFDSEGIPLFHAPKLGHLQDLSPVLMGVSRIQGASWQFF